MPYLDTLNSADAARALEGAILLLPVGAVEPHGPHLPLSTDTLLSVETARLAAEKLQKSGHRAWVAPAIPYSITDFSEGFAGRVSVAPAAMGAFSTAVLQGLATLHPRAIYIITLHFEPAHLTCLRGAAEAVSTESMPVQLVEFTKRNVAARIGGEFATGSCHAGSFESSLVLAVQPGLVDQSRMNQLKDNIVPLAEYIRNGALNFQDCNMPDAYCGFPARSTAAEGVVLYGILSDVVVEYATGVARDARHSDRGV